MAARILVVEDSPSLLELYRDLLEDEGYDVVLQPTPQFDPAMIFQIAPDLIILDLVFEGNLSGWDILQALKQERATASIPIVVCSGATKYVDVLESAFNVLGVHVLTKPFNLENLLDLVRRIISQDDSLSDSFLSTESLDRGGAD
jgi:DNA-binding response OmpR family regulator